MSLDTPDTKEHTTAPDSSKDLESPDADLSRLVGDGYDPEPLLTAEDVGVILQVPTKSVYELPIPKVRLSKRRIRYRPEDIQEFIDNRASKS